MARYYCFRKFVRPVHYPAGTKFPVHKPLGHIDVASGLSPSKLKAEAEKVFGPSIVLDDEGNEWQLTMGYTGEVND